MSAEAESESAAAEFDHPLLDLEQLKASVAASDARIARIREAIHALGYGSVARALAEPPPTPDDTIASHEAPTEGAAGPLPWMSIAAIVTASTLFMLLGGPKPSASNNRDVRSISLAPVTTAIAAREDEPALADRSDTGIGLRQAEQSTVAPPQEATTEIAPQPTLPPSEDDASPAAPP